MVGIDILIWQRNIISTIASVAKLDTFSRKTVSSRITCFVWHFRPYSGLYTVVSPELLGMFCAPELQVLISGAVSEISVDDLKANTRYTAGYHSMDRNISRLWSVVSAMSEADRSLLVKFVTSCERPPSLGFGDLSPPFTIQVRTVTAYSFCIR